MLEAMGKRAKETALQLGSLGSEKVEIPALSFIIRFYNISKRHQKLSVAGGSLTLLATDFFIFIF